MSNHPTVQWGDPNAPRVLPDALTQLLQKRMKWKPGDVVPYPRPEYVEIPRSQLSDDERRELSDLIGFDNVNDEHDVRLNYALGKSYLDIVAYCSGKLDHAPDAVLFPASTDEVTRLLSWANEKNRKIIPFGGGTSVVGGVTPEGQVLTLSTRRMADIIQIDIQSQSVHLQTGIFGPALESQLNAQDFTLGHFPQSFEFSTVGGWIAARSAGQQSTRYGKIEDLVIALTTVTPSGTIVTRTVPAEAAGPDIDQIMCGSEGTLGVMTEATLRIHRLPPERRWVCALLSDFETGLDAVRQVVQGGMRPATVRLFDAHETRFLQSMSDTKKGMASQASALMGRLFLRAKGITPKEACLVVLGFEGSEGEVEHESRITAKSVKASGATIIDDAVGEHWFDGRFKLPYLRDPLIQHGLLIDTFETSTTWGRLFILYREMNEVLKETLSYAKYKPVILTHLSHVYPDGASLYFTLVIPARADEREAQWGEAQQAVMRVLMKSGASLSHHHGIGKNQAALFREQAGPVQMGLLGAIKNELDPNGIMNPGKLGL